MRKQRRLPELLTVLILIGAGVFSGCSREESAETAAVLHRGLGGEPGSLDPAHAADTFSFQLIDDLYEGLVRQGADGHVLPGVAKSWTVSSDGLTYTFVLRDDARWSNGEHVKAQDFINSWRRLLDPKVASPEADNLRVIAGAREILAGRAPPASLQVAAPRDDELVVTLDAPAVYFPQLLTHASAVPVYSEKSAAAMSGAAWVSNGPYLLVNWTLGGSIKLTRNPAYWDQAHVAIGAVEYVASPNDATELTRYRAGALDITETVPSGALQLVKREMPNELHVAPILATAYYAFNLHQGVFKDNRELRRALTMAIDRSAIQKALLPFGQKPAYSFVAEGVDNYTPQPWAWKSLRDDERIAEAKTHYANAGYSVAKPLKITLLYNTNPAIRDLSVVLADTWRQVLGVETSLVDEEYRVFLQSRHDPARWDVVRLGWNVDYNDAGNFLDTFRSGSVNNDSGFSSAKFDELLRRASQTADSTERRALLEESERVMLDEYPIAPIYFLTSKRLMKPYATGGPVNPMNRLPTRLLTLAPH